jgi:hypothetical protein
MVAGEDLREAWKTEPGRHIYSTAVTLILGFLAAGVALYTSLQAWQASMTTTAANLKVTADQNHWQQVEATRVERSQVYVELLTSATEIRTATNRLIRSCPSINKASNVPISEACEESNMLEAVDRFQRATSRMRAIASAEGRGAADELAAVLPTRSYRFPDGTVHGVDREAFTTAYTNVLRAMCLDTRRNGAEVCG